MQTLRLVILFMFPLFCTAQKQTDKSFTSLSKALQHKNSVESLIINYPLQKDSIQLIETFPFLQHLELNNQSNKITIDFSKLSRLRKLILNSNFSALPESINGIKQVDSLILYHNDLTELPSWVCEMKGLKSIGVVGNKIKQFPDCFFSLKYIENIYTSYNDVSIFDSRFFSFPNLINLSLSGNKITALPKKPKIPSSLRIINFSDNETTLENINAFRKELPQNVLLIHNTYESPVFNGSQSDCADKDTSAVTIFTKCETCPQFQGGDVRFKKFLNAHLDTSIIPEIEDFSTEVVVKFAVFREGGISQVRVLTSDHSKFATESIRLIKESCAYWIPANFSGRLVNSWITLKLYFTNQIITGTNHKTVRIKIISP